LSRSIPSRVVLKDVYESFTLPGVGISNSLGEN
jgi:hypothetical protein